MKKAWILLLLLLVLLQGGGACAQGETPLPEAVTALCAQAYPGYEIAKHDGWSDERCGQFALILRQGNDNILCIAEKAAEEADYRLTVDNTNAVYDGDVLPGLLIDTGGDALFYTYHDVNGRACEQYHAVRTDGAWGAVDATIYLKEGDLYHSINGCVSGGTLYYLHCDEDELGNVLSAWEYAPVAADEGFEASLLLENFDISTFDTNPADGLYPMMKNEAFVRSQSVTGETIVDMAISPVHIARLFERADGTSLLRIDDWNGEVYDQAYGPVLIRLAGDAALDTYHAGEGSVLVSAGVMMYDIERADAGSWYVTGVDDSGVRTIGPDYAAPDGQTTVYRNDGYIYGRSPWGSLSSLNSAEVALGNSYEQMAAQLDQSAYALVNNPNPADRLHLRVKPDKGAKSLGKFYNRTPVIVLDRGKTWTHVQIGRGRGSMTGYMMTKYLVFDERDKAALACAFPQKQLKEGQEQGVQMFGSPNPDTMTDARFTLDRDDFIIGVYGDEWYVVLRADGAVGYVPQSAFWEGNG